MAMIVLFRVGAAPKFTPSQLAKAALERRLNRVRKDRPELSDFMLGGGLRALPAIDRSVLKDPAQAIRLIGDGYALTDADLHGSDITVSLRNSVDLWLKAHVPVERDNYALLYFSDEKVETYKAAKKARLF